MRIRFYISITTILCGTLALHQDLLAQKGVEVGTWAGSAFYFGDLNNLYRFNEPGLCGGLIGRYNFNSRLSARVQLNYLRLRASDEKSNNSYDRRRNLSFFSDLFELAPALELNFFTFTHGSKDQFVTPYMYGGFSVFQFNPKTKYLGKVYALRNLGTEGQVVGEEYNAITTAWLVGGGVKLDLNYRWSLNFDIGYRNASNDYIDDVSKVYPNYTELAKVRGPIAVALADRSIPDANNEKMGKTGFQRGNSKDHDAYLSAGINLVYFFGRLNCPQISVPD